VCTCVIVINWETHCNSEMTLYMPPLSTKKRGGEQKETQATTRVFGNYDATLPSVQSHYRSIHGKGSARPKGSPAKSRVLSPARLHKPHPAQVGFLLQDCRLMHEPICDVQSQTKATTATEADAEADKWWKWTPSRDSTSGGAAARPKPKYSYHSSNRDDYRKPEKPQAGQTRHGSNPASGNLSHGIVPVTSLASAKGPRLLVEHISYDHQYNSRTNPSQPIRGKKHGSFVWDCLHPVSPPKLAATNRTTVLSAPWASSGAQQDASPQAPDYEGGITRREELGLGTLEATVPQLPAVAS
jgi:hypothetical protein